MINIFIPVATLVAVASATYPALVCTLDYSQVCRCSDGTVRPESCLPISSTSSVISTPTSTTIPPYPTCNNSTLCTTTHAPTGPTVITTTATTISIETITWCPPKCTCHGQTTTWTHTHGPSSCHPHATCTCVLPGTSTLPSSPPTLTSCPRSVTCTGQTTTITGGVTVVLPSETFNPPIEPTHSSVLEFPGAAATGGVGILAIVAGVFAAL